MWKVLAVFLMLVAVARPDEPRPSRILFFHAKWCKPCHEALEGPAAFPDWLRKSGWKVGETSDCHVQIIDIDSRDDLKTIHKIESIPSMVVLGGDGRVFQYKGRQSLRDILPKQAGSSSHGTSHAGEHSHKCGRCGHEWWHGGEKFGSTAAHTCPKCGTQQWVINQFGPRAAKLQNAPVFRSFTRSGCPTGNCPLR